MEALDEALVKSGCAELFSALLRSERRGTPVAIVWGGCGVTIAAGGVLPNIHAVLLPKKTAKSA